MAKRQHTQKEMKLLSWWLATYHPRAEISMQVRVGPTQPMESVAAFLESLQQVSRVRNRWCDAIFVENGHPTIVEAQMAPDPSVYSQLVHYARMFRLDPYFAQYADQPLHLIALNYADDPLVAQEAPWYGVQWIVYSPVFDGWLPPVVRGTAIEALGPNLPWDWAARIAQLLKIPPPLGG